MMASQSCIAVAAVYDRRIRGPKSALTSTPASAFCLLSSGSISVPSRLKPNVALSSLMKGKIRILFIFWDWPQSHRDHRAGLAWLPANTNDPHALCVSAPRWQKLCFICGSNLLFSNLCQPMSAYIKLCQLPPRGDATVTHTICKPPLPFLILHF